MRQMWWILLLLGIQWGVQADETRLPPVASPGDPLFFSNTFAGSGHCMWCHNNIYDQQGRDVSIGRDWSSTMMANASRDPFWRAKVRSELNRHPELAGVIVDKCSRCHAPMANETARQQGGSRAIFGPGMLSPSSPLHDAAMDGVSCTVCHQIEDGEHLGTLSGVSGRFKINGQKLIYGPYDQVFGRPMLHHTGYWPVFSPHIKKSELCASCHNLKTPFVDENGELLATTPEQEFPEQMPYSEWLHSDYANIASCQDCHMTRTNGVVISQAPPWLKTRRDQFALHEFVGGNMLMLDIFNNNREQLGVLSDNFAETMTKTEAMLKGAASLKVMASALDNETLSFTLQVTSHTGHKLPTGYPSRRIILHVKVSDAEGNIVFESGRVKPDGSVDGLDSDLHPDRFEPHYDVIQRPEQVQVYEAIMANNQRQLTYTLLRGADYLKDNRILPAGFDKQRAPADIRVHGKALDDANFAGGGDRVRYRISGLSQAGYQVEAALIYQPLARGFANDLFQDDSKEVRAFEAMFNTSSHKSTTMTSLAFTQEKTSQ